MENLRIIREKRNKNQLSVAMHVGVTQETISNYESGRAYPSVPVLIKLAKYLNTSVDYLLGLVEDSTPIRFMNSDKLTEEEQGLLSKYNYLATEDKLKLTGYIDALSNTVKN